MKESIKIGAIIPLTGPAAQHVAVANAIQLAAEEINVSGGINGRKIELIIVDSKTNPENGKKALAQIEAEHHPLLYISTTSLVSMEISPLAEAYNVVLAGLVVSNPEFTKQKEWVFKYYVSSEDETKTIQNILNKQKIERLGILYQNDAFGSSHNKKLKALFEETGGSVTSKPFEAKEPDFKEIIPDIKGNDAIYVAGFVNVVGQALKELRAEKYKGMILSHSGATSLPLSMPELQNVYIAAPIIYNPNYVFARKAKERYETRYKKIFTHQAANGYDFMKLLAGLLEGEDLTRDNIRKLLEGEFSYPGVFGYIEKKQKEHDIPFPLYPARIVEGQIYYLQ